MRDQREIIERVIDKQFDMIGVSFRFKDIPDDGMIKIVEKKKDKLVYWYDHYKFSSKQQYEEWRDWAYSEFEKGELTNKDFIRIDMLYSMNFPFPVEKKEGEQLDLFKKEGD